MISLLYMFTKSALALVHPIALAGKWIGRQTDPMWQGGGRRDGARLLFSPYSIEKLPVNASSLDPEREQLLILAFAYPGGNGYLSIFISSKQADRVGAFHLSPVPVASLVGWS